MLVLSYQVQLIVMKTIDLCGETMIIIQLHGRVLLSNMAFFCRYISGVNGVFKHVDTVSERERRFWESRGMNLFAWTINDLETKNYLKNILHVPYITDDCTY